MSEKDNWLIAKLTHMTRFTIYGLWQIPEKGGTKARGVQKRYERRSEDRGR